MRSCIITNYIATDGMFGSFIDTFASLKFSWDEVPAKL